MRKSAHTSLIHVAALWVACIVAFCPGASAQSQASNQQSQGGSQRLSPEELRVRQDWHISMAQIPLPRKGCFQAQYPNKEWRQVACVPAPNYPLPPAPPRHGPRPLIVGNNNDVSPQTPSGFISTAIGSFDSASGITTESGPVGNSGPSLSNTYTLQLNTNFFASKTVCKNAADPSSCSGWQQFVFENNTASPAVHKAYIQYWLIQYNTTCPAGQSWNQISLYGGIYCWKNDSGGAAAVPSQPITNLGNLSLTGTVSGSGDQVSVSDGTLAYAQAGDNAVDAVDGWNVAEFNIFGDGGNSSGGGTASFAGTPTLTTRTRIIYGGRTAPTCTASGFTAEKNNLSFGPTAPAASQPGPAIAFTESSAGGATSNCAGATAVGDTHLATFNGLFYDFQASGEFVLAQADPNFVVQTRQVSGAPTWPNATVNSAVATQMGKDRVAVCLAPARLNVNGTNREMESGTSVSTPDGVDIWRTGNVYVITDQSGNSVRAEVNPTWINVSVGLGRWPEKVSGLLANVNGNVNTIAMRDGTALNTPFSFTDLYQRFGESWRVKPEESLLSACGGGRIESGIPTAVFTAADLEAGVRERARAVCTGAGVKGEAYLDACTLDVAVIGNNDAAKVFVNAPQPVAVATITGGPGGGGGAGAMGSGILKWLLWLILILVVLWVIRLLLKRKTP